VTGERDIDPRTVRVLAESAHELLEAESTRGESFNVRASGLAAFIGLVLPLGALVADRVSGLDGSPREVAIVVGVLGLIAFIGAVVLVVLGVLLPNPGITVSLDEIERYPSYEFVEEDALIAEGRVLRGRVEMLVSERLRNDQKGIWLRNAYLAFLVGVVAVAVEIFLIAVYS
jgi:hypothetical protein